MYRTATIIVLLVSAFASNAIPLNFDWDDASGLPPGFYTEIQANGVSQATTSKPVQIDVPLSPGGILDAKARHGFNGFAWVITGPAGTTSEIDVDGTVIPLTDTWYTGGVSSSARVRTIPPSGAQCGEPPEPCLPSDWMDVQRPSLSPWSTAIAATFPLDPSNVTVTKQGVNNMAIAATGSAVTINSATNSSSQSVTIPADATIFVATVAAYSNPPTIPATVLTLGGTAMTRLVSAGNGIDYNQIVMEYMVNPPTGTQTLAWNVGTWKNGAVDAGNIIVGQSFSGVDTASPWRSSTGSQNAGSLTGLTFSTGDVMIGGVASDGTGIDATASSQTLVAEVGLDAESSVFSSAMAYKSNTGTFDYTGESFPGAVAGILKPAAAAGVSAGLRTRALTSAGL